MNRLVFDERLKQSLEFEIGYPFRLDLQGRPAAVLVLLSGDEPQVLITKRSSRLKSHQGQYSFPGGMLEQDEAEVGNFEGAAIREFVEEMGPSYVPEITVIGRLPSLTT
ncbi:MAG: NUDIX domain-containing protein, partial [Proteobacteria bacterium]